jgi:hypothetical protein
VLSYMEGAPQCAVRGGRLHRKSANATGKTHTSRAVEVLAGSLWSVRSEAAETVRAKANPTEPKRLKAPFIRRLCIFWDRRTQMAYPYSHQAFTVRKWPRIRKNGWIGHGFGARQGIADFRLTRARVPNPEPRLLGAWPPARERERAAQDKAGISRRIKGLDIASVVPFRNCQSRFRVLDDWRQMGAGPLPTADAFAALSTSFRLPIFGQGPGVWAVGGGGSGKKPGAIIMAISFQPSAFSKEGWSADCDS